MNSTHKIKTKRAELKQKKDEQHKLDKRTYLALIQGVITRQSNHAVTTHNWGIVAITGCITWECTHYTSPWICTLNLPVWAFFAFLSSFFHWNERRYIALYNGVVSGEYRGTMFSLKHPMTNAPSLEGINYPSRWETFKTSRTLTVFWLGLLLACTLPVLPLFLTYLLSSC